MEVFEAIRGRRSIRKFKTQDIEKEKIEKIILAGRQAPSAGNLQARDLIVITDQKIKEELVRAAHGQAFIGDAPYVIMVCSNEDRIKSRYGDRGTKLYMIQDASASVQNMLLAAHSLGLGTCWVGAFDDKAVHEIMGLEKHLWPVAIVPIGHPAKDAQERPKRDDDVSWL